MSDTDTIVPERLFAADTPNARLAHAALRDDVVECVSAKIVGGHSSFNFGRVSGLCSALFLLDVITREERQAISDLVDPYKPLVEVAQAKGGAA